MFTKRHYEWLARFVGEQAGPDLWHQLAYKLGEDSPKFDYDKFIAACERAHSYTRTSRP